jgi:hypothetical protein
MIAVFVNANPMLSFLRGTLFCKMDKYRSICLVLSIQSTMSSSIVLFLICKISSHP